MTRKVWKRIGIAALVLILMIPAIILLFRPHYLYVAGEYLGVSCEKTEITAVTPDSTVRRTFDELRNDGRVEFNQSLMLVNTEHPLPDGFVPAVSQYRDTKVQMDACMHDSYAALAAGVKDRTGERLLVSSDFRTQEEQKEEYAADSSLAIEPGASEHQAGLALDVYVPYYASYGFIKTEAGQLVNSECWKYGFIIRYPSFGEKETGIRYEPWHIRYVGEPHAKLIYGNHLTLEEYISGMDAGVWYAADGYLISRQTPSQDGTLELPEKFAHAVISPDNTGSCIVTVKTSQ